MQKWFLVIGLAVMVPSLVGCEEKKEPLYPDNPDPVAADGGAPGVAPAEAAPTPPPSK